MLTNSSPCPGFLQGSWPWEIIDSTWLSVRDHKLSLDFSNKVHAYYDVHEL